MALTQDEIIAISKKIILIPQQNAQADTIQGQLEDAKIKAQKEDDANKKLMDDITPLVNAYQSEFERYDGNGRTQLIEQDMLNSAAKKLQNPFFPNDPQTSLPSIPDNVWKNFPAFSGNKAIGKNYNESFSSVQKEQDLIDAINTQIATIETFVSATRSTSDECVVINVPPLTDTIQPSTAMIAAGTALISAVQAWEDFINTTSGFVPTAIQDPDAGRIIENDASRDDITNAVSVIDTWQAIQDYDLITAHPPPCATFDAMLASAFVASKFRSTELQPLKDEITARQIFITTRIGQLNTNLGSVTQDFSTGEILAVSGFHGNRFRIIDMRLNLMGGSLNKLKGIEAGQDAQDELKASNNNAAAAYTLVITATAFRAPASGTSTIHVLDGSGFSVSDSVFIIANNQQEISTTISSIQGNTIFLANTIPKKYRENEGARLYKIL